MNTDPTPASARPDPRAGEDGEPLAEEGAVLAVESVCAVLAPDVRLPVEVKDLRRILRRLRAAEAERDAAYEKGAMVLDDFAAKERTRAKKFSMSGILRPAIEDSADTIEECAEMVRAIARASQGDPRPTEGAQHGVR